MNKKVKLPKFNPGKLNKRGCYDGRRMISWLEACSRALGNPMGQRIKQLRHNKKMSQEILALKMGWSLYRIAQVENRSKAMNVIEVSKMANILKSTSIWILLGKNEK